MPGITLGQAKTIVEVGVPTAREMDARPWRWPSSTTVAT
jgi:hypothetical protein